MQIMKLISLGALLLAASSCGPEWAQDADDLITRQACSVTVDKSAITAETEIDVLLKIRPKTTKPGPQVILVNPKK